MVGCLLSLHLLGTTETEISSTARGGPATESARRFRNLLIGGTTLFSGGYYVSHLEQVPMSGRRRFMDCSPTTERAMAKQAFDEITRQYRGRFLPPNHPYVAMVRKVARKIIRAAGVSEAEGWEFYVIDSPGTPLCSFLGGVMAFP